MPAPSPMPNSTGSIANVRLIIMISSFDLVFVYEQKMQELFLVPLGPPPVRHYGGQVARSNANSRTLAQRAVNKVRLDFKLEISKSKLMFEFSRSPKIEP